GFGADTLPSIKLLDFGVSKMEVSGDPTTAGVVLGTASYMAPEQARGIPVDTRADVYAVGVLLYEMVTGSVPFSGEDFFETMWRHVYCAPLPPRQAHPELP